MSDTLFALRAAGSFGWKAFRRDFPVGILLFSTLPRQVLQAFFFTLLAYSIHGDQRLSFALQGAPAVTVTLITVAALENVTDSEMSSRTFYRHRLTRFPVFPIIAVRTLPYVALGFVCIVVTLVITHFLADRAANLPALLAAVPFYLVMTVTTACLGLAVSFMVGFGTNGTFATNLIVYLLIGASGGIVPLQSVGPLAWLGRFLPLQHGMQALRAHLDGRPWFGRLLLEVGVGAAWLAAASLLCWILIRRMHRAGKEYL